MVEFSKMFFFANGVHVGDLGAKIVAKFSQLRFLDVIFCWFLHLECGFDGQKINQKMSVFDLKKILKIACLTAPNPIKNTGSLPTCPPQSALLGGGRLVFWGFKLNNESDDNNFFSGVNYEYEDMSE